MLGLGSARFGLATKGLRLGFRILAVRASRFWFFSKSAVVELVGASAITTILQPINRCFNLCDALRLGLVLDGSALLCSPNPGPFTKPYILHFLP